MSNLTTKLEGDERQRYISARFPASNVSANSVRLKGDELLSYIKDHESASKTDQCLGCGYVKESGKLAFTDWYEAILEARGVSIDKEEEEEEEISELPTTYEILDREFNVDELRDIANNGMAQGVNGFIYTHELLKCFNKHEDEILGSLDYEADDLGESSGMSLVITSLTSGDPDIWYSLNDIKTHSVWTYVEIKAYRILCDRNDPEFV